MPKRTILIFPQFENIEIIENIRKQFDPLYDLIKPHITLVFPFEDRMSNEELETRMEESLIGIPPFKIVLQGISCCETKYGKYLFLDVSKGKTELTEIHSKLYRKLWGNSEIAQDYIPHMTVGNLSSSEQMEKAYLKTKGITTSFETTIKTISVEAIGPSQESIIILEKELKTSWKIT